MKYGESVFDILIIIIAWLLEVPTDQAIIIR